MADELDDFWVDVRPPPLPRKEPSADPEPAPQQPERGYVWFALVERDARSRGLVRPRIRAAIPNDNPMTFVIPYRTDEPICIVGLDMFDRETGGTKLYEHRDREIYLHAGDTLNFTLTLADNIEPRMAELAGLRVNFRLRGLL